MFRSLNVSSTIFLAVPHTLQFGVEGRRFVYIASKLVLQARRAVLSSERSHLQGRLGQLQAEVEASHQAMAAIESRKLSGETLLSKVSNLLSKIAFKMQSTDT